VLSEFVSQNGCKQSFSTKIRIDSTDLRFNSLPEYLCKAIINFDLDEIGATPKGGKWYHNLGNGQVIALNSLNKYPTTLKIEYVYVNPLTQCNFIRIDSILVTDSLYKKLPEIDPICKEINVWNASTFFGLFVAKDSGFWEYNPVGLIMDTLGLVQPRQSESGTYHVYRHRMNAQGCNEKYTGKITIRPAAIDLSAKTNIIGEKPPLLVAFEGKNNIGLNTNFKWHFGDINKNQSDTAWGPMVKYTYNDTGSFFPILIGFSEGCSDTLYLDTVQVKFGGLKAKSLIEAASMKVYPNPTKMSKMATIQVDGAQEKWQITIMNSIGKKVAEYELQMGQNELIIHTPPSGIYSIHCDKLIYVLKWVVE
jgi:hypothetical protein